MKNSVFMTKFLSIVLYLYDIAMLSRSNVYFLALSLFISSKPCCFYLTFLNSIQSMGLRWPPWCEQSSLNSRSNAHCDGAAMAPLCKLVKGGAVRANDLPLSNDLEAWPDSSVGRAPTYNVRARELKSRSGRLFSRTFTFYIAMCLTIIIII